MMSELLSRTVIEAATRGDVMAVNCVLDRYEPYIRSLCMKNAYGEDDGLWVDEEMKNYLESSLVYAVVKSFKINS